MNQVTDINLPAPWVLLAVPYGEASPMACHRTGEVAVDAESLAFVVHEVHLVAYGTDSVVRACLRYLGSVTA